MKIDDLVNQWQKQREAEKAESVRTQAKRMVTLLPFQKAYDLVREIPLRVIIETPRKVMEMEGFWNTERVYTELSTVDTTFAALEDRENHGWSASRGWVRPVIKTREYYLPGNSSARRIYIVAYEEAVLFEDYLAPYATQANPPHETYHSFLKVIAEHFPTIFTP